MYTYIYTITDDLKVHYSLVPALVAKSLFELLAILIGPEQIKQPTPFYKIYKGPGRGAHAKCYPRLWKSEGFFYPHPATCIYTRTQVLMPCYCVAVLTLQ